jgi:flagellar protein FlbD
LAKNGGSVKMIRLYRHDGLEFLMNVDLISQLESAPDTVITLLSGEKIKIKNTIIDVTTKIKASRQGIEEENRDPNEPPENSKPGRKFPRR